MNSRLKSADGFYGWVNLLVVFLFNMVLMPIMISFMLFLPFWVKEFNWSYGLASGAQTVFTILMGFAAPLVAILIMKQGAKRAIVGGNILCVAGLIWLSFQNHIWQLYLGVGVLLGLGVSIGGMLAMMTVINNWFIMKRTMALAIAMASMGFSGVVVNPSLMWFIETMGWRHTYLLLAAAALLFCVILPGLFIINKPEDLGQIPDGPASTKHERENPDGQQYRNLYKTPVDFTAQEALRTPALWLLVGYGALSMLVAMGAGTHIIAFQFDIGIPAITAAFVGSVFSAVMGIGQIGVGFLGLRVKMHYLAVGSMILAVVGFSMLLFAESLPLMIAYAIIFGMGSGIQFIAIGNLFPDYFGRSQFPKIMGYTMPFNTIISSIGAPVIGHIRDTTGSYIPAFRICLVLLILAFFCILFAKPPVHPSLKTSQT